MVSNLSDKISRPEPEKGLYVFEMHKLFLNC